MSLVSSTPCPWVLPHADAAGYYRWTLPDVHLDRLIKTGWRSLSSSERFSVADALSSSFSDGSVSGDHVFRKFPLLAADSTREVVTAPIELLRFARYRVLADTHLASFRSFSKKLYGQTHARLGFKPKAGETGDTKLLRRDVADFLVDVAQDPAVRKVAVQLGQRYLTQEPFPSDLPDLASELIATVVTAAIQDGDPTLLETAIRRLKATQDAVVRSHLLHALGAAADPQRAERVRSLMFEAGLRVNETLIPLSEQLNRSATRDAAWAWLKARYDEIARRLPEDEVGELPWLVDGYCTEQAAKEVYEFFSTRLRHLPGAPRNIAGAAEHITLCAAQSRAQSASLVRFFTTRP
jgi:cytosol alanyl aminopeptidase